MNAPGLNKDRVGVSSTATVYLRDQENNDPQTAISAGNIAVLINGETRVSLGGMGTNGDTFTAPVGSKYEIWGGNGTAYVEYTSGCILDETMTINVKGHTAEAIGDLAITCYDSTGATALSGGTNSSQEDYDITLGANEDSVFYCKQKVGTADAAYDLLAIITKSNGDIDDTILNAFDSATCQADHMSCKNAGSVGFKEVVVPKFLRNIIIIPNEEGAGDNMTSASYDHAYLFDEVIRLQEFDEVKYHFTIEAGATNPATNLDFANQDCGIVCFMDGVWDDGSDGMGHLSFYTVDGSESNVGRTEDFARPTGRDACVVIEGL
jgi:hypothetical protein